MLNFYPVLWKSKMTHGPSCWGKLIEKLPTVDEYKHTAFNITISPPLMWYEAYFCISQFAEMQQSRQACFLLVVNPWVTAIRRVLSSRAHPSTTKWENLFQPPVSLGCLLRDDTCDSSQGKDEGWMILRYQTPFSQSAQHPPSFTTSPACNHDWPEGDGEAPLWRGIAQSSHSVLLWPAVI